MVEYLPEVCEALDSMANIRMKTNKQDRQAKEKHLCNTYPRKARCLNTAII